MCFQSKVQYRKFAVTPREVWNVLAVPFLPWPLHTLRTMVPDPTSLSLQPWTGLRSSSEKPLHCGQSPDKLMDQEGFTNKNLTRKKTLKVLWIQGREEHKWRRKVKREAPQQSWVMCLLPSQKLTGYFGRFNRFPQLDASVFLFFLWK